MQLKKALLLLVVCFAVAHGANYHEARHRYQQYVRGFTKMVKTNPTLREQAKEEAGQFGSHGELPEPSVVNCQVETSPVNPTSVDRIRPSDVRVVAALGDSITAGNGVEAQDIVDVALQNRGRSWCIGGEETFQGGVITLANMFKHFNPDVAGFSLGSDTDVEDPEAGLNVAIPGDVASGMVAQANDLVDKLQSGNDWDFDNDWKIITLLIGGNDLCQSCHDWDNASPENWRFRLTAALDVLRDNIPRAIVNLHPMFDITPLRFMSTGPLCDAFQLGVCSCAIEDETRPDVAALCEAYNQELLDLVNTGRYNTPDFTVVLQMHTWGARPPMLPDGSDVDRSYWSPDCFHPGTKGHYAIATSLWNNMLEPVGQKKQNVSWEVGINMKCPTTENPYIFTPGNSGPGTQLENLARKERLQKEAGSLRANVMAASPGRDHGAQGASIGAGAIIGITVGAVLAVLLAAVVIIGVGTYVRKAKTVPKANVNVDNPAFEDKA